MKTADHYRLRGYSVSPLSIEDIRGTARRARGVLQLPDSEIQLVRFLEQLFHFGITVDVINEREMPGYPLQSEAYCIPDTATIYLASETYRKVCRNDPRALFTVFHELGHLILGHSRTLHREQKAGTNKPYYDSEWQADQFAAEMTMPHDVIMSRKLNTPAQIQARFGVSLQAAQTRYEHLRKRGDIK